VTKSTKELQVKLEAYSRAVEKLRDGILYDDFTIYDKLTTEAAEFFVLATNALDNAHRYLTLAREFLKRAEPNTTGDVS
jgi:hypothetical protein